MLGARLGKEALEQAGSSELKKGRAGKGRAGQGRAGQRDEQEQGWADEGRARGRAGGCNSIQTQSEVRPPSRVGQGPGLVKLKSLACRHQPRGQRARRGAQRTHRTPPLDLDLDYTARRHRTQDPGPRTEDPGCTLNEWLW